MGNRWRLALVLAVIAAVFVGLSAATHAQGSVPVECNDPSYDFDDDGKVTRGDLEAWRQLFLRSGCPESAKVLPGACHPDLDLNGDGIAGREDMYELLTVYRLCLRASFDPPRR